MHVGPFNAEHDPALPEDRIIDAIVSEIAETGLAGLSIDRVASRAAVSKTTIYNRWRTKDELVVETFSRLSTGPIEFSLDDGLRAALRQMFDFGRQFVTDPRMETLLAELFAAAHSSDAVRQVVADFRSNWYVAATTMLGQARDSGELPSDTDVEFLAEVLAAFLTYRVVSPIFDEPFDDATVSRIEALVLETPPRLPSTD
jgi:AcrR family transcriptional regulator